jgi:hypothetical protein
LLNVRRYTFYSFLIPNFFSLPGSKRQNHNPCYVTNVKDWQSLLIYQIRIRDSVEWWEININLLQLD